MNNRALPGIGRLLRLRTADSTQTVARGLAEGGAPHGTLVWALRQTAGRGRLERRWDSGPGGLYFSLILRPAFPPRVLAELSLTAARAAAEALAGCGVRTRVKPPNDVIGSRGRRSGKLCGILAEARGGARRVDWVVLGVGINVNNRPLAPGAASLRDLTGKAVPIARVLRLFLERFQPAYRALDPDGIIV
ncbi:MAG: biotin--[acetyl-CoA-carboxylase] ligase [Elusimicrobia bacterium]|nr:biotin--[acetyl-CoA-carboxylase] ligase [Elusimicrobiota bacterium]